MLDRDWRTLLHSLELGSCVALIGPGLCATDPDGEDRILTTTLSRRLSQILEEDEGVQVQDTDNLPLVAEFFLDHFTRDELETEVCEFYAHHHSELGESTGHDATFESLAALPLPVIISARHDQMLQHYLSAQGKNPTEKSYDFHGDRVQTIGQLGTVDRPLVYHLLGSVQQPSSVAITESDQLDLLEAIISGNPALPTDLRNQFQNKSFLFLGCGIHHYHIRVLLHALGLDRSQKRSFALDRAPPDGDRNEFLEKYKKRVLFYRVGYKSLKLLDLDESDFVQELHRRWEEKYPPGTSPPASVPGVGQDETTGRPTVFVSYVREDASVAQRLVEALKNNGIEPWFDQEKLRGGDQWSNALDDAIGKEADFFIVLLSEHFRDGVETYVHLEVAKALERSSKRGSLKFIYPLKISEEVELLDALDRAKIQAQSLLGDIDSEAATVATDIKKQFAKLQRRG